MVFAVVCRYLHKKVATEYSGCAELGAMDAPNVSKLTAILGKHQGALMVGDTSYSSSPGHRTAAAAAAVYGQGGSDNDGGARPKDTCLS